jgi:hypothetical protein
MSNSTSKSSKASLLTQVQALMAGTQKHNPNGQFTLGGATYTAAALGQLFKSLADAFAAVDEARASFRAAVSALRGVKTKVAPVMVAYRKLLRTTLGNDPQTLSDYGLEPTKAPKPRSGQQNAAASAKAKATRDARGTKSKKQLLEVHGNVTGIVVTPVTVPAAAPSPSTQPASATPGANSAPKS